MELEEAKKKLELMEYKYTLTNNDDKAIETVLQALENSIPKKKAKSKIREVIKLIEQEQFKIIMGDTTICSRIKWILEKELLEDK